MTRTTRRPRRWRLPHPAARVDRPVAFAEQPSVDAMRHLRHVHVAGRCVKRTAGPHCEETR